MKILLVEDDDNKREDVYGFLASRFPEANISSAGSYSSSIRQLMQGQFDLVLLDMTIPTFDKRAGDSEGRLRPLGGKELLDQMKRRNIAAPVVVLTGYDILGEGESAVELSQVVEGLQRDFPDLFVGAIFYSRSEGKWKAALEETILRILRPGVES